MTDQQAVCKETGNYPGHHPDEGKMFSELIKACSGEELWSVQCVSASAASTIILNYWMFFVDCLCCFLCFYIVFV